MDSEDLKYIKERQKEQSKMFAEDRDRYNTLDIQDNEDLYRHISRDTSVVSVPKVGQTWESYIIEMKIHTKNASDKNWQVHVIKGVRGHPWYTHDKGDCFMCHDINLHYLMYHTMLLMLEKHPDEVF